MSNICAIDSCSEDFFRHGLCQRHYSVIADEAAGVKRNGTNGAAVPVWLSAIYVFNRLTDNLIEGYRRAFRLDTQDLVRIQVEEARDHIRNGAIDRASEALGRVASMAEPTLELSRDLGDLHLAQGRHDEALSCFRDIERAEPKDFESEGIAWRIGEALCGLSRYEEALPYLELATQRAPDNADAYHRLGVALEAMDRYDDAIRAFESAAEIEVADPRYRQALGFAYEAMGQHEDALSCFKHAIELER